ncbi:MAG: DUF4430 domain-containing protein [Clostridia bacterium]|nr:DUF4430 domain-containing protein [Clostridia bacterium]
MKNKKIVIGLAAVLVVIVATFSVIFINMKPETKKGEKNITVTVVFKDKSEKEFKIDTDAKYLGDALLEEKIVTEDEYKNGDGMYTYIAGERADYNLDKSWWCLNIDGEMAMVGINEQPIADGDSFEITNTPA